MIEKLPAAKPASFNDTQLVEINGRFVHSPGERAKPRPPERSRRVDDGDGQPTQFVVNGEESPRSK